MEVLNRWSISSGGADDDVCATHQLDEAPAGGSTASSLIFATEFQRSPLTCVGFSLCTLPPKHVSKPQKCVPKVSCTNNTNL